MNKAPLNIAAEVSLPPDLATQSITVLAKRRVGKSYLARKIWELLLTNKQHAVFVDPKGDQWGIRSSANGKHPGFPVLIIGGEHGDLPLEKESGELIARLVVEQQVNILLDTSHLSKSARAVFMAAFLENLYRLKAQEKYRTPLCVIVDEADEVAPQRPQKGEERMLGAIDDIVRRGGQRGLGSILITQRSASLNKNVLTQSEMLILLRTIAPQDLAAVKAWIDVHGTPEQQKIIMEDLPSLPRGDAYFWSPAWPTEHGMFVRAHVLPIETFDSAKTPEVGEKRITPKNLADVDLDALKGQMDATIEKKKNEDPKVLLKIIADLEAQIAKTPHNPYVNTQEVIKAAVDTRDKEWELKVFTMQGEWIKQIDNWFNIMQGFAEGLKIARLEVKKHDLKMSGFNMTPVGVRPAMPTSTQSGTHQHKGAADETRNALPTGVLEEITAPEQRVLNAVAWCESIGNKNPPNELVAFLSGYSHMRSTGYTNPRGYLKSKGLITYSGNGVSLTDVGRARAVTPETPLTQDALHHAVLARLDGPEKKLLIPLLERYPDAISNTDLCAAAGYMHERSTGYTNPRGRLKSFGLIEYEDGSVKAASLLFL